MVKISESRRGGQIARDQRTVDCANRGADDPIGFYSGVMQRLVNADLVGPQRAAALHHQYHLSGKGWPGRRPLSIPSCCLGRSRAAVHRRHRCHCRHVRFPC